MNIFSLIYDPVTSTPFAVKVVGKDGNGLYGLTNNGRDWAQSAKSIPSGMVETSYAPFTEAVKEKIAPMVSGDEFIPLDELRSYVFPELKHSSRKVSFNDSQKSVDLGPLHLFSGKNKLRVAQYKALNFLRMRNQGSSISEMKINGIYFDARSNLPKVSSNNEENQWASDRIVSILGRGTSRRMGIKSRQNYSIPDSENQRINRRVKSLIGENINQPVSNVLQQIDTAMISRLRRR